MDDDFESPRRDLPGGSKQGDPKCKMWHCLFIKTILVKLLRNQYGENYSHGWVQSGGFSLMPKDKAEWLWKEFNKIIPWAPDFYYFKTGEPLKISVMVDRVDKCHRVTVSGDGTRRQKLGPEHPDNHPYLQKRKGSVEQLVSRYLVSGRKTTIEFEELVNLTPENSTYRNTGFVTSRRNTGA